MTKLLAVLAAAVLGSSAALAAPPESAYGITAGTPIADLTVIDSAEIGAGRTSYAVEAPAADPRLDLTMVNLSNDGLVCEVVATTYDLPAVRASAVKAALYLHLSSRHGAPVTTWGGNRGHEWRPQDGSAAKVLLGLERRAGDLEAVIVAHFFTTAGGTACPRAD